MEQPIPTKKFEINRIKTYIDGLDQNIGNGVPEGHVTLVCGSAGTMKSSICFNIAYNEALAGKTSLYISLEQSWQSLLQHMRNMGYDLNAVNLVIISDLANLNREVEKIKLSKRGSVIISDIGAIRKEIKDIRISSNSGWLNVMKNIVKKIKTEARCDIFVLDSLSALYVLSRFENPRIELFYIFEFLRDAKMTSFLISEMPLDQSKYSEFEVEDYLSDGIIHIKLSRFRRDVVREISIVKMRATDCNHDIFSLEFKKGKFQAMYGGQTPLL
jgi:KaiC/GvpD/RAD55 family RecA-like ATPase